MLRFEHRRHREREIQNIVFVRKQTSRALDTNAVIEILFHHLLSSASSSSVSWFLQGSRNARPPYETTVQFVSSTSNMNMFDFQSAIERLSVHMVFFRPQFLQCVVTKCLCSTCPTSMVSMASSCMLFFRLLFLFMLFACLWFVICIITMHFHSFSLSLYRFSSFFTRR